MWNLFKSPQGQVSGSQGGQSAWWRRIVWNSPWQSFTQSKRRSESGRWARLRVPVSMITHPTKHTNNNYTERYIICDYSDSNKGEKLNFPKQTLVQNTMNARSLGFQDARASILLATYAIKTKPSIALYDI